MSEEWRPVVGWEGLYEVSSLGRVRSLDRWVEKLWNGKTAYRQFYRGGMMRLQLHPADYFMVGIHPGGSRLVHHLVLEAFVGPCPPGQEACHANDDGFDNRLTNLRWDSHAANCKDRTRNDKDACGERNGNAVLTAADVDAIRASSAMEKVLAPRYGVTKQTIGKIRRRERWMHV